MAWALSSDFGIRFETRRFRGACHPASAVDAASRFRLRQALQANPHTAPKPTSEAQRTITISVGGISPSCCKRGVAKVACSCSSPEDASICACSDDSGVLYM